MEFFDQSKLSKSPDNINIQRQKNRERQRRYRERKRLLADMKKAAAINQLTSPPAETTATRISENGSTRIHCIRDWKKDARRVHAVKEEILFNVNFYHNQAFESENREILKGQAPLTSPCLDDFAKNRSKSGRRDWKADARNKKQ